MAGGIPGVMVHADSGYPELHKIRVKNSTGSDIPAGRMVAVTGASGPNGRLTVELANGSGTSDEIETEGLILVAQTLLKADSEGIATLYAAVAADTSAFTVGDPLYLANGANGTFSAAAGSDSDRLVGHVIADGLVLLAPALLRGA